MITFSDRLLTWFDEHGRKDLPWQREPTSYRVWISEVMLQQTQVAAVIPYYQRFMESFPDLDALAGASLDNVLHHWSGLGYYARARNLHKTSIAIKDEHAGVFPTELETVLSLPGIGRSTAGAILALSAHQRHPILDGNVKRVLARYHAVDGWPGTTAVANTLWGFAEQHTPQARVADYTQAIMDLGATVCTRRRPGCDLCPMAADCIAHASETETDFPGRRAKKAKPLKVTQMLLVHCDGELFLQRRPESGIWGGLWGLPELRDGEGAAEWCERILNSSAADIDQWETLRHSFSHYDLDINPIAVRLEASSSKVADSDQALWYTLAKPPGIGLAAPVTTLIGNLQW